MHQTSTLQTAIETVEALSIEEQDFLIELIHKRRHPQPSKAVIKRRQEIVQNSLEVMEAIKNGTANKGTAADIIAYLLDEEDES